ncbi:hypothetical protein [Tenacibaculum ascidiaceicola]|uniref:hypothetical protein n=1 Tax=Tenacibaculum ascidiaceicola TaxID=1699411 RepID=UPI003CE4B4E8
MKKILLIVGGKSTGIEIREVVNSYYINDFDEVFNFVGEDEFDCPYSYIKQEGVSSLIEMDDVELYYITSMTNQKLRIFFINDFLLKGIKPFNVIHPNSMISSSASIGKNIYIASGVVLSSFAKVCDNVIINYGVLIGHDAIIKENCIFNPGSKVGGNVIVNENVLLGAGTFIKQGVEIGANTLIDAMCYIREDLQPNKMIRSEVKSKEFRNIFI